MARPISAPANARVIARLLERTVPAVSPPAAAPSSTTRPAACIPIKASPVWLKADVDILFERRVSRRANRPLLKTENPRATVETLIESALPDLCPRPI